MKKIPARHAKKKNGESKSNNVAMEDIPRREQRNEL